jgi:hypothetical protein
MAPLESFHAIVTDAQTSPDFIDAVQKRGLRVVVA